MKRTALICSGVAAAICATAVIGPAVGSGAAVKSPTKPLTIVFDTTATTHQLVFPKSGSGLSPRRGDLRQDPGRSGMFAGTKSDSAHRISQVSGATLQTLSAVTMAAI